LLFNNSDLGSDQVNQVSIALQSSLDAEPFSFDGNRHLLVSEFQKTMDDGHVKILEVD